MKVQKKGYAEKDYCIWLNYDNLDNDDGAKGYGCEEMMWLNYDNFNDYDEDKGGEEAKLW